MLRFAVVSLSSKHLAAFYYQFGTMIQSGVPIQRALTTLQTSAPHPMRPTVATLSQSVNSGESFHEAMGRCSKSFPALDLHTVTVSEQSGALDVGLLSLSKYHDSRARARSRILSATTFPALLLIAAVFISHFPALLLGAIGSDGYSTFDYLRDTVGQLALLAIAGFVLSRIMRWLLKSEQWGLTVDRVIRAIPFFGSMRFTHSLSQWLSAIRLMLNAGHGILQAMEYSSRTVPSPLIVHAYEQAKPLVHGQLEVSEALRASGIFPDQVIQFWATGEESGRLDEMLDRLARFYEDEWQLKLDGLATWLPRIVYGLVALYIIFQIGNLLGPLIGAYSEALE